MRYLFLLILFPLLQSCSSSNSMHPEEDELKLEFYDSKGKLCMTIDDNQIDSVVWRSRRQEYFINNQLKNKVNKLNMLGGRIRVLFRGELLDSVGIRSVFHDYADHDAICNQQGRMLPFDKNAVVLPSLKESPAQHDAALLHQQELYHFLAREGKLLQQADM